MHTKQKATYGKLETMFLHNNMTYLKTLIGLPKTIWQLWAIVNCNCQLSISFANYLCCL